MINNSYTRVLKPLSIINNILKTSRITVSLISGVFTFMIIFPVYKLSIHTFIRCIPIVVVTMIGFILNDLYDIEKDRRANKNRPICKGMLLKKHALLAVFLLSAQSLIIDLFYKDSSSFLIILITLIGVIIYSPFAKNNPLFKGLFTALLCCSPLMYGLFIVKHDINFIFLLPILVFIIGREILLDIYDFESDLFYKMKTIPNLIGISLSKRISWGLMISGCMGMFLLSQKNIISIFLSLAGIIIISYLAFTQQNEKREIFFTRIVMLIGSITAAMII